MESIAAVVTSPAYLGIPDRTVNLSNGVLTAVEGGKIRIDLTANRPLADASFGPTRAQTIEEPREKSPAYEPLTGKLEISGVNASTPVIDVGSVPFEIPFTWNDHLGLAGESGFRLRVDALRDAVPTCYLQGIDRQKVMLPEETVDFEVLAEDDFGVKQTGIEWSGQFTRPSAEAPAKGELKLADGAIEERRIIKPASFSPAAFGIAPQKITLRGYVEDHFPKRGRIYSEPITLYVLTRDEHVQMLKSKFDRNITEFEDLARREQELLDENQRLERLTGEELQKDEPAKRLETQEQAEAESKRRMENLTERMEELMKDAARNGDVQKETLKKMAESLKSMQELSQQDLPQGAGKTRRLARAVEHPGKSPTGRRESRRRTEKSRRKNAGGHRQGKRRQPPVRGRHLRQPLEKSRRRTRRHRQFPDRSLRADSRCQELEARPLRPAPSQRSRQPAGEHRLRRALASGRPRQLSSPAPRRRPSNKSSTK